MKTRTIIKSTFNMVEIALAIAIIALGLSSIISVFPVGLSTSNAAVADNNIPDAAEYLLGYLEAVTRVNWQNADGSMTASNAFLDNYITQEGRPADPFLKSVDYLDWKTSAIFDGVYRHNAHPYIFKFEKSSTLDDGSQIVDFSTAAVIWKEPVFFRLNKDDSLHKMDYKYAVALCVELSWPLDRPYDLRDKRVYRLELFNTAATP